MTTYEPGTVAMVTAYNRSEPYRAYFDGKTWRESGAGMFCVDEPTSLRPLVVLDPEDREQVERLADLLLTHRAAGPAIAHSGVADALREFANPTPPKPPEPTGLGAVVEDSRGYKWTNTHRLRAWYHSDEGPRAYAAIDAVRVLSEGVTA